MSSKGMLFLCLHTSRLFSPFVEIFDSADTVTTLFAEVLLPVPIPKRFTYRVPHALNDAIQVGARAIVQFGDRKILTGLIAEIHQTPPGQYEAKYILELLDASPIVSTPQFKLLHWIAAYYLCTPGEVMNATLPSGLRLSSESMVQLHPSFQLDESDEPLSDKELMVVKALQKEPLGYSAIAKLLAIKHPYRILKSLASRQVIILFEEVKEKFKPRLERRVRLMPSFLTNETLASLFDTLASKPKQEAVLLRYLQMAPVLQNPAANQEGISRKKILAPHLSESSLNTLIKHQVLEEFEVVVSRFETDDDHESPTITLSTVQEQARKDILSAFEKRDITLLHGITGSGKTEIYIRLIQEALAGGSQVLYLLPEIALTTQIVHRLKKIFGPAMGIYHSRFSDNERVEVWNGVLNGRFKFVVGVRSSVFLPFDNLGLIIVDEEHDPSYKQQEPAPRYHARDVALILGQFHHAKVLLGSATPSIESYYHARQGRYGFITLMERYGEAQLPQMVLADLGRERRQKTLQGEFSQRLLLAIEDALSREEQVIVFQNRRGYSPMMSCEDCGWVPKCINCAVSLTYHQYQHSLVCHYCGYKETPPTQCPECTSTRLRTVGYGTEKLAEELSLRFPDTQIQRMDLDTTRSKTGYEKIIDQFEKGETKILVGTQMITKGLDFDRVSLVGIFNADRMVHFPDFRSYERAYQLITQVSGRAGRRDTVGKVVIQTSNPDHPLLQLILKRDYAAFYESELPDRQQHGYPPFTRLMEITVRHADKKTSRMCAAALAGLLRETLPSVQTLGPGEPMIARIRNQYLMSILLKIPRNQGNLPDIKEQLAQSIITLQKEKEYRSCRIIVDVDPA